jgi:O-antigen ligase
VIVRALGWLATVALALALGAVAVIDHRAGIAVVAAVLGTGLVLRPAWAAVLAVAAIPFPTTIVPGLGLNIAATDLLTVAAVTGWSLQWMLQRSGLGRRHDGLPPVVRPLAVGLLAYGGVAALTLVVHPSSIGLITSVQRAELIVGALLLGAGLVRAGFLRIALEAYLLTSVVLALVALADTGADAYLGVNKNPAGGFLAAALLIAILIRPSRRWMVYTPVLAAGVLGTQSRGAILGLVVAVLITIVLVRYRESARLAVAAVAAVPVVYALFRTLSTAAQVRLLDTSASTDYALEQRTLFQADALDTFRAHPWLGIGVGNYQGGPRVPGIVDPHNVLYLTGAEGGVLLLAGFTAMFVVALWAAYRSVRLTRLGVVALAVQISTMVHGQADVYWVRGTPMPAFVLLGAALAVIVYHHAGDVRAVAWMRPVRSHAQRSVASRSVMSRA